MVKKNGGARGDGRRGRSKSGGKESRREREFHFCSRANRGRVDALRGGKTEGYSTGKKLKGNNGTRMGTANWGKGQRNRYPRVQKKKKQQRRGGDNRGSSGGETFFLRSGNSSTMTAKKLTVGINAL